MSVAVYVYFASTHVHNCNSSCVDNWSTCTHFTHFVSNLNLTLAFQQFRLSIFRVHCIQSHLFAPIIDHIIERILNLYSSSRCFIGFIALFVPILTLPHGGLSLDGLFVDANREVGCFDITNTESFWVLSFRFNIINWQKVLSDFAWSHIALRFLSLRFWSLFLVNSFHFFDVLYLIDSIQIYNHFQFHTL